MVSEQISLFLILLLEIRIEGSNVFLKVNDSCLNWNITRDILCDSETSLHCVLNENYVQGMVCAKKKLIQGGLCPFYRTDYHLIDARACSESHGECPKSAFLSYASSKYSGCYSKQSTVISKKSTTRQMPQTSFTSTEQTHQKTISTTSSGNDRTQDDCNLTLALIVGTAVFIVALPVAVMHFWITRKKPVSSSSSSKLIDKTQSDSLLM